MRNCEITVLIVKNVGFDSGPSFKTRAKTMTLGVLHELNQMVSLRVNHLVKCRPVA